MNNAKAVSFDTFLFTFETMIINTLVAKNQAMIKEQETDYPSKCPLSSVEQMLKVAFRFYDKNLF